MKIQILNLLRGSQDRSLTPTGHGQQQSKASPRVKDCQWLPVPPPQRSPSSLDSPLDRDTEQQRSRKAARASAERREPMVACVERSKTRTTDGVGAATVVVCSDRWRGGWRDQTDQVDRSRRLCLQGLYSEQSACFRINKQRQGKGWDWSSSLQLLSPRARARTRARAGCRCSRGMRACATNTCENQAGNRPPSAARPQHQDSLVAWCAEVCAG